jgi:hypothetical protein
VGDRPVQRPGEVASTHGAVMETIGHSQMRMTMAIYSLVMPVQAREAADCVDTVLLTGPASRATRDDSGRSPKGNGTAPGAHV